VLVLLVWVVIGKSVHRAASCRGVLLVPSSTTVSFVLWAAWFFCSCSTWMDWIIEVFFSLAGGGGGGEAVFRFPLSVFYAGDFG
jgi:hypothetical protein